MVEVKRISQDRLEMGSDFGYSGLWAGSKGGKQDTIVVPQTLVALLAHQSFPEANAAPKIRL